MRFSVLCGCLSLALVSCSDSSPDGSGAAPSGGSASGAGGQGPSSGGSSSVAMGGGGGSLGTGGGASTMGGGELCETLGWCEITDTMIDSVCPNNPEISGSCSAIVDAWSGGIADEARNRLIVWGGGHNDYWGNEVYALDLESLKMLRLNSPSPQNPTPDVCTGTLPDGTANSRHTYNGLAYVAHADRMSVFSGGPACLPGGFDDDTWTFKLDSLQWEAKDPTNGGPPQAGVPATAYDPTNKRVYLHDTQGFWSYDYDSNTYERLIESAAIDYHLTAAIDPVRRLFILFGGGQARAIDIDDPTAMLDWDDDVSGCNPIRDAAYPGLAYDSVQNVIVGWAGGDTVYMFDADTQTCTPVTFTGGPGPQPMNGTNGRFRYLPDLNVFALVNSTSQNARTLRLTPAPN